MYLKTQNRMILAMDVIDPRRYGWRISRPWIQVYDPIDMDEIERIDLSLNSCKIMFIHFRSSIFFRELLTSIRPYFMWSRTSRVDKLEDTTLPDYLPRDQVKDAYALLQTAVELTEHQDLARRYL